MGGTEPKDDIGYYYIYLKLDRYDNKEKFRPELLLLTLTHELAHVVSWKEENEKATDDKIFFDFHHDVEFWETYLHSDTSIYKWVKTNIKDEYWKGFTTITLPSNFPWQDLDMKKTLWFYFPDTSLEWTRETLRIANRDNSIADRDNDDELKIQKIIPKIRVDEVWKTVSRRIFEWVKQELTKDTWNKENVDELFVGSDISYEEADKNYRITHYYHKDSPFRKQIEELIDNLLLNKKSIVGEDTNLTNYDLSVETTNKGIEKTFSEIASVLIALWNEASNHINDWKNNPNHPIKKEIEKRASDLLEEKIRKDNSQPTSNYNLYELKRMLIKIVGGLPDLVNKEGKMNQELLSLLTNFLAGVEKLKTGKEEWITIPDGENSSYELVNSSEKEKLENELAKEKRENAELRKKLASLEATEKDKNDQLEKRKEEEQQARDKIKTELALIDDSIAFPSELSAEKLIDSLKRLQEMKKLKESDDLSCKFVAAALSGDKAVLEVLKKRGANMGDDPNFLRAALALPYQFGRKPEEILVGVGGSKSKPFYPAFKFMPSPPVVDEELWNRHLGNPTPPKLDKERSEQIMLLIVMTFLKNQPDIMKEIDISFENPLIKDIWGKEVPKEGSKKSETKMVLGEEEKNKVVEAIRKVLHTVIDERRKELKGYEEDKNEYLAAQEDVFSTLVKLYRVVNEAEIKVEVVPDKEKEKINVKITYPKANEQKLKKNIGDWEEIDVWRCHRCLKINNGYKFCEQCGIDVRIDKKEEEKIRLMEELQANIEVK